MALYGALEADVQDRAIAPAPAGRRKVVLATSIAETSLTIEGVRVVIDCGLARVPRYEPDVGLTRLETVRVSRASADQRRGRAGRTEPGVCYRLWDEPQTASLDPANKPEMLAADLSGFVLDLAHWGVADPSSLAFLDPPPARGAHGSQDVARRARRDRRARDASPRRGGGCETCRCRRASRAWWSMRRRPARRSSPPRSRSCSPSAGSAATTSISPIALDALRRDRSHRARDARAMAKRWAEIAGTQSSPSPLWGRVGEGGR